MTTIRVGKSASHAAPAAPDRAGQPTDPAGPTGRLSCWLANTTLDDVPATVRERAKHLILDGIACALVGAQLPVSRTGVNTGLESPGFSRGEDVQAATVLDRRRGANHGSDVGGGPVQPRRRA
jgi:hypothetical protein